MKERKNKAVLGFKTSVATPCHNGFLRTAAATGISSPRRASRIILTPRKQRYAEPVYFTASKARADLARMTETPAAAASTCTIPPRKVPRAERVPSRFPPAKLLERT